jgi:hypothetical protein
MTDKLLEALEPFLAEARKHLDTLDDGRNVALFLSPEQCRRLASAVEAQIGGGDEDNSSSRASRDAHIEVRPETPSSAGGEA